MKAQVESITPVKTKLTVEISAEELAAEELAALNRVRRSATLPGFRKGKAPMSAIKTAYGASVRGDVFSEAIRKGYAEALTENELIPVNDPDIEIQSAEEGGPLSFVAVVEVRPTVEPTGYTGLALKREEVRVDETAVEARLGQIREQHGAYEPAAEAHEAQSGDLTTIDFVGTIDGIAFDGGTANDVPLVLGSGRMIPGFEDGLIGAKAGEERTVQTTFPEEYRAEDLAGKQATFAITVKEIKQRVLPELDDELAKQMDLDSLDELREKVREAIRAEQHNRIQGEFRRKVQDVLLAANPFEVPDSLVQHQKDASMERVTRDLAMRGLKPEDMGLDQTKFQDEARTAAERLVRWAFLLDALATQLGIEVSDEDVDARIREIAENDGRSYNEIRAFFDKQGHIESLKDSIREQKCMDEVLGSATVEEVSADEWTAWRGDA